MRKGLYTLLALILLSPVTGELWRLPVMGFALLPSDILIPVFIVLWVLYKFKNDRKIRLGRIGSMILIFIGTVLIGFMMNAYRFPSIQMIVAATYLIRTGMYVLLTMVIFDLFHQEKRQYLLKIIISGMVISMLMLVALGFLQLIFFSDFLELGLYLKGWDPHIDRLTSTWLDPNFIAGYLSFMLGLTIALGLYFKHRKNHKWFLVFVMISALGLIALYYTFSRSGYLAFVLTLGILAFFKSRKLFIAAILIIALSFIISPRVQVRLGEAFDSAKALTGVNSQHALDPTARLRVWSWSFAIEMIQDYPWIGVGYNRYPYEIVHRGHGLSSDHNAGGSDSSLLTLWATTGMLGLITYLAIGFVATLSAIKKTWHGNDFNSYLNGGLLAGFGGIMLHSIFVNSLLFPLMMIYLWTGLGLLDAH
jgi:O-antigen ligase